MFLLLFIIALVAGFYFIGWPKIQQMRMEKKLAKWANTPKDLVILHAIRRGTYVTHGSPFVVKVETFMRMAKINYKGDFGLPDAWGPKGRFPWISINGQHIGDSQLIIDFLKKKFDVKLGTKYKNSELAQGAAMRIMMDDHFFWGLVLYRFVYSTLEIFLKSLGSNSFSFRPWLFRQYASRAFLQRSKGHGIGLHSQKEIEELTMQDLRYLSDFLGEKKFLLGDDPCEYDCTIFGHLSQVLWSLPGSIYEKALHTDASFANLKGYCYRMKETFYPDWDTLVPPRPPLIKYD